MRFYLPEIVYLSLGHLYALGDFCLGSGYKELAASSHDLAEIAQARLDSLKSSSSSSSSSMTSSSSSSSSNDISK